MVDLDKLTERQLWMMLVEAEFVTANLTTQAERDDERCVRVDQLCIQLRVALRDRYGINLDDLNDWARDKVIEVMTKGETDAVS